MELETGKKYDFVFIAVETRAPYGVGVYDLSKGFDIMAATEYKTAYDRFNECRQTGIWNDYEDEIVTLRPYKK